MFKKKTEKSGPIEIDLTGPDGNVFALMAYAKRFSRQLNIDGEKIIEEMREKDYKHALNTFEKHFGKYVILLY